MPTKRIPLNRSRLPSIPPEAIELFRRGLEIQAAGGHEEWEEDGGRRSEWLAIRKRLDWTLLKRLGEISVLDPVLDHPEMRPIGLYSGGPSWDAGVALRKALLDAIAP
jgi:hypothetical protein